VLNPTCNLLALLGAHHILHVSRIRVKVFCQMLYSIKAFETTGDLMAVSKESSSGSLTSNRPQDGLVRYKQSQNADRSVLPSIKRGKKKEIFLNKILALCHGTV